jgi:hypothetical protein
VTSKVGPLTYRFLTNDEVQNVLNPALAMRGQAMLSILCASVLGAFDDEGTLVESLAIQLFPVLGPLTRHDNEKRDAGETTRTLVDKMSDYLRSSETRGLLCIADSPFTERLCARYGMQRVESPVFVTIPAQSGYEVQ